MRAGLKKIDGIFLLDKPSHLSSNHALQRVKKIFAAQKAGHTGSLDPLATGMLPICFGEATKFSHYLLDANKTYLVSAKLGIKTTTGDLEGEIISQRNIPVLNETIIIDLFAKFTGTHTQIPPMYSALKHQGQPLYKLARQGIEIERKAREVHLSNYQLINFDSDTINFEVTCSKGTYIRSLVEDMGESLGCGAHISNLRRLNVAHYQQSQMLDLPTLTEIANKQTEEINKFLLPVDSIFANWNKLKLNAADARSLLYGQTITSTNYSEGWICLYSDSGNFLGIGEALGNNKIVPRRLVQLKYNELV